GQTWPGDFATLVHYLAAQALKYAVKEDAVALAELARLEGHLAGRATEQRGHPLGGWGHAINIQTAHSGLWLVSTSIDEQQFQTGAAVSEVLEQFAQADKLLRTVELRVRGAEEALVLPLYSKLDAMPGQRHQDGVAPRL